MTYLHYLANRCILRNAAAVGPPGENPMSASGSKQRREYAALREYAATRDRTLAMPDENAVRKYEGASERYAADGDRAALMRSLLELGVAPKHIHWHLARPGRRMICLY
jgi:hypothetical protein